MLNRRKLLCFLTAGVAALGFVVAAIADELLGTMTKVDVDAKRITVVEKESDKEYEFKITDETKVVTKKGEVDVDLEKLQTKLKKAQDDGKKGITVTVTHDKGKKVATKLQFKGRGKGKKADN
jgi:hypothetical protein